MGRNHTTVQGEREVKLGSHEITVTIIPSPNGAGLLEQEEGLHTCTKLMLFNY